MAPENDHLVSQRTAVEADPALLCAATACRWTRVDVACWRSGGAWDLRGWRFPDTWLAVLAEGAWRLLTPGPAQAIGPGAALLMPPGHRFDLVYADGCRSGLVWGFHCRGGGIWRPAVLPGVLPKVAPYLPTACHDQQVAAHLATRIVLDGWVAGQCILADHEPPPPAVERLLAAIETGYADPGLDLPRLAATSACSPAHLRRLCKQACGRGPHDLLVQRRLDAACRHLREGWAGSMADLARAVGFLSQARFHAVFRTRLGRSPRAWAQARG